MRKHILALLMLMLIGQSIHSQPLTTQDRLALKLPDNAAYTTAGITAYIKQNFLTDTERIRAIFVWVAGNINYDIERYKQISKNNPTGKQAVEEVLKTRSAVCGGYADLFSALCDQCNLKSIVVGGYTKLNNTIGRMSHAWVAAELDHTWYLFDPTWAAGYVNNDKFTKTFSNTYYKVVPAEMIKDHMPFDPMYQFLHHTLSNREFIEGKTNASTAKPFFSFTDTLQQYNLLSKEDKTVSQLRRIKNIGIENDIIKEYLDYLNMNNAFSNAKNGFEQAMDLYNRSIALFNRYIACRNNHFSTVSEDKEVGYMIDSVSYYVNASWSTLSTVVPRDQANKDAVTQTFRSLEDFQNRVNKEKEFVALYLRTDKSSRSRLFLK